MMSEPKPIVAYTERDLEQCDELERHIAQCLDEHVFDVNGNGVGRWRLPGGHGPAEWRIFDIDQDVSERPVIMVRRSDGTRFVVEVDVTVTVQP